MNLEEITHANKPHSNDATHRCARETYPGEKRVATVPDVVEKLIKLGFKVAVESGAGDAANFSDESYRAVGAEVLPDAVALWSASDIVLKVRPPSSDEVALMREGGTLIGFVWPAQNPELMQQLAARKVTVLAIDCLPRTLSARAENGRVDIHRRRERLPRRY
jgi:NAD(P) transhydrogenase subunit alpha